VVPSPKPLSPAEISFVFDEVSFWSARFGRMLVDRLDFAADVEALDVGCGNGFPTLELAHSFGPGSRFTGIDVWAEALARAERKRRLLGTDHVRFVRCDAARLPFAGRSFDLVVSNVGINNFAEPRETLFECARVTRPGARLVVTTNLTGHMKELYDVYRAVLEAMGRKEELERLREQEEHRRSPEILSRWIADAGFTSIRAESETFRLRYRNGRALFTHPLTRHGFLDGWRGVVREDEADEIFAAIERRLDDLAAARGSLDMTVPMLYLEATRRGDER
jgi:arsenite methyltransferase